MRRIGEQQRRCTEECLLAFTGLDLMASPRLGSIAVVPVEPVTSSEPRAEIAVHKLSIYWIYTCVKRGLAWVDASAECAVLFSVVFGMLGDC